MLLAAACLIVTALPAVAQTARAVLVEWDDTRRAEDHVEKRYDGSVTWRTERVKSADGQDDMLIRADVDIPGRNLKMAMSVRRNLDPSVQAGHLIEMKFTVTPDYIHSGPGEVFGVFMKETEGEKPAPEVLQGTTAKTNVAGAYVTAVWNTCKNLALMKGDPWFAIYFTRTIRPTAYLMVEKGQAGQAAFDAVFAAWERSAGATAKSPACPRADAESANSPG